MKKILTLMSLLFFVSCSRSSNPTNKNQKIKIEAFGLTSQKYEIAHVGLKVTGSGMTTVTQQLLDSQEIEITTGSNRTFVASALFIDPTKTAQRKVYYTTATTTTDITTDTSEISIVFEPVQELSMVNVYGLVYENTTTPAANADLFVIDPTTSVAVTSPGLQQIARTNAQGIFSFAYAFNLPDKDNNLKLRIRYKTNSVERDFVIPRNTSQGKTLDFINLSNPNASVLPQFSNLDDFDGDGVANSIELNLGTNPFSEISGAPGPAGTNGSNGTNGANCYDGLSDLNGDGSVNTADCRSGRPVVKDGSGNKIGDVFYINWPTVAVKTDNGGIFLVNAAVNSGDTYTGVLTQASWASSTNPGCYFESSDCSGQCLMNNIGYNNPTTSYPTDVSYMPRKDGLVRGFQKFYKIPQTFTNYLLASGYSYSYLNSSTGSCVSYTNNIGYYFYTLSSANVVSLPPSFTFSVNAPISIE